MDSDTLQKLDRFDNEVTLGFSFSNYKYNLHSCEQSSIFGSFYESIVVYYEAEDINHNFVCYQLDKYNFDYIRLVLISAPKEYSDINEYDEPVYGELRLKHGSPSLSVFVAIEQTQFSNLLSSLSNNSSGYFNLKVSKIFPEELKKDITAEIIEFEYES